MLLACETAIAYCGPDETGDPLASHATHSHFHRLGLPRALLPGCMRLYIAASTPSFTTLLPPPTALHARRICRYTLVRTHHRPTLRYAPCACTCTCTTPSTVEQKESTTSPA